jgi:hypothetical protein
MVFRGSDESVRKEHAVVDVDVESVFGDSATRGGGWVNMPVEFSGGDGDEESRRGVGERMFRVVKTE